MRTTLVLLALTASLPACSKHKATCETYVQLSLKCEKDSTLKDDEKEQEKTMLTGMCVAAFDGEYGGATADEKRIMKEMYEHITTVASCAEKATTCDEYAKCEDSAKKK